MKSEHDIRRHRANLRVVLSQPCACRGASHEVKCQQAQVANAAVERTLSWLLWEYDELQRAVDAIEKQVGDALPGEN